MNHKNTAKGILILGFLFVLPAQAAEGLHWKSTFIGGAGFSGKTDYTTKISSGSVVASSTDHASAAALFAGEFSYQPDSPLGAAIIVEGTRYAYNDPVGPPDGQFGIFFMPRLASSAGPLEIWSGVGLGGMRTALAVQTVTQSGVTVSANSTSIFGFAWSPRIGLDLPVGQRAFIGFQLSYTSTSGTLVGTTTYQAKSMDFTEPFTRNWMGAAIRIGSRF